MLAGMQAYDSHPQWSHMMPVMVSVNMATLPVSKLRVQATKILTSRTKYHLSECHIITGREGLVLSCSHLALLP